MSSQCHPPAKLKLFVFAAALLLYSSISPSASGQIPNLTQVANPNPAPNPPAYPKRFSGSLSNNRSKRASSNPSQPSPGTRTDDKQQAIEQAIEQGNQSRGENDYKQALSHYQKAQSLNSQEARTFYGMGNVYSDLYCYDSAIEAYLYALKFKKDYLESLIGLGYAYAGKERYDDAEKQFHEALNLKPDSVDANIGLGRIYLVKGKYQEAITQINLVINSTSVEVKDRAAAHVALGNVYWKQAKWQDAIAQFEEAIRLKPDLAGAYIELGNAQTSIAYSKLGSYVRVNEINMQDLEAMRAFAKQAAASLEKAKEHNYKHPNLYVYMALALAYQFRYEDAISQLKDYFAEVNKLETQISPQATKCGAGFDQLKANGYWFWGDVYYLKALFEADDLRKNEFFDKALEHFNQAIKIKEDFATAYSMIGNIYSSQEKHEDAISQYKKAILFSTDQSLRASLYGGIGLTYSSLKRYDDAIENTQEAIKLAPNDPSSYVFLASIYIGQGKLDEALAQLKKAGELRTESAASASVYYQLGVAYGMRFINKRKEEDFNEAIKLLKEAIKIRPKFAFAYQTLGGLYLIHSNADEALANYEQAIKYDPKDVNNYLNIARVYFELKNNDEAAIQYLEQAIKLQQDFAQAHWRMGLVYHHKNNDAQAIIQMLEAIKYDPKYVQAYLDLAEIYKAQKNYPEAIKHLTRAAEIAPTNFYPYKELAKIYEAQQKNEDAIRYYEEALNRLPADDSSTKNLYLGRIARLKGQYAEAIEYFRKVNFPDEPGQTYYEIGVMYIVSRNKRAALEQHQQLVQLKSPLAEELLKKIKEMK